MVIAKFLFIFKTRYERSIFCFLFFFFLNKRINPISILLIFEYVNVLLLVPASKKFKSLMYMIVDSPITSILSNFLVLSSLPTL